MSTATTDDKLSISNDSCASQHVKRKQILN